MLKNHSHGYAIALFLIAQEQNNLIKIKQDAQVILNAIQNGNTKIIRILSSKTLKISDVEAIIFKAFKSQNININLVNFMNIVSIKQRGDFIIPSLKKLISLINEKLNIKEGIIYSTIFFTKAQILKIEKKIETILGYKPELINKLDPELISGFKIVVNDEVVEDSIISRVHNIKYELLRGVK